MALARTGSQSLVSSTPIICMCVSFVGESGERVAGRPLSPPAGRGCRDAVATGEGAVIARRFAPTPHPPFADAKARVILVAASLRDCRDRKDTGAERPILIFLCRS